MKRMINNAENLEHIYFIIENIDFFADDVYTLDNKNGEPYRLAEHIRYCADYSMPCIIFSSNYRQGGWLLVGFSSVNYAQGIFEAKFTKSDENEHHMCTVRVDFKHSTLTTNSTAETFLTAMYRHNLKISHDRTAYDDQQHDIFLTYYSSNNLVADTPEKLTTLTKAINGTNLRSSVYTITSTGSSDYDKISLYYIGAVYNGSAWNLMNSDGTSAGIAINSVSDTVEEA